MGRDGGEGDCEAGRGDRILLHRWEYGQGLKRPLRKLGWFLRRLLSNRRKILTEKIFKAILFGMEVLRQDYGKARQK